LIFLSFHFFFIKIAENQPLVSDKIPTTQLQNEYAADDKIYQDKVAVNIELNIPTYFSFYFKGINKEIQIHSTYTW
jgi:hypothetical protein